MAVETKGIKIWGLQKCFATRYIKCTKIKGDSKISHLILPCYAWQWKQYATSCSNSFNTGEILHQSSWTVPGMHFRGPIVVLASSFPHPKIRSSIGSFHIVHQILNKVHFIHCVNDLKSWIDHLSQGYQKQGNDINLEGKKGRNKNFLKWNEGHSCLVDSDIISGLKW